MNKTKDFHLKQFSISGGNSGMAVSTDGILLGAWANLTHAKQILDIGTGTGLLALMAAQRNHECHIQAIDIDPDAVLAAKTNVKNSPWPQRVAVKLADITKDTVTAKVDHIICNPPYFNSGVTTQWHARAKARHTLTLGHQQLLDACQQWLVKTGEASFILPNQEGKDFIQLAQSLGWNLSRLCEVNTTENKLSYRLLIALTLQECDTEHSQLTIHQNGQYSQGFIDLTREFYLKM